MYLGLPKIRSTELFILERWFGLTLIIIASRSNASNIYSASLSSTNRFKSKTAFEASPRVKRGKMGEYNKAVVQECLGMQRQEANFATNHMKSASRSSILCWSDFH
uniref:Uncharacterized protein n=1 Tax=Meloidogyne incognita TaxID=6306 RepID=A0A914L8E3_MELIC